MCVTLCSLFNDQNFIFPYKNRDCSNVKKIRTVFILFISPFPSPQKITSKTEHTRLIIPINNNQTAGRETKTVYKAKMADLFGAKTFAKKPNVQNQNGITPRLFIKTYDKQKWEIEADSTGTSEMIYWYYKQNMD